MEGSGGEGGGRERERVCVRIIFFVREGARACISVCVCVFVRACVRACVRA